MAGFKGGNNAGMQNLMRQAQKMQEEMEKTAQLLDDWEIVDPTDVEMLEDLIMAAINDGYAKADKVYEEKMGRYGDMGALGGML